MHVVIAGGPGKIAHLLTRDLTRRGDQVTALIRNPDHSPDPTTLHARPVICDLEHTTPTELATHLADAVVFATVLLALLDTPATAGRILELVTGDTPVPDAVAHVTT